LGALHENLVRRTMGVIQGFLLRELPTRSRHGIFLGFWAGQFSHGRWQV
jgi:hypothetical protein